ncbi:MAG: 3-isopropylmalate dehydratase [Firmicutes bacterium]|nr:3-isopropylmalate dehydratase [Bacillota bacterium]
MVELLNKGVFLLKGSLLMADADKLGADEINSCLNKAGIAPLTSDAICRDKARKGTIAHQILSCHNKSGDENNLKLRFDALASHDITYVGIVQTARASGLKKFPVPYVLTNCHNSLCAVGGTINEDDHVFGLSAAHKYGGIYVPAHQAVIHQYVREMMTGCGKMILGSDSHTRYGALGTMGVGEGGPELVKQILEKTYDLAKPEVIAVYLEGEPAVSVGPQDVALAIIKAVFNNSFVKNKVLEFVGPGIAKLSVDYRNGIDVMTTETTCLSSIWVTDEKVADFYRVHGRTDEYKKLEPGEVSYYDGLVKVDLSKVEPMIALPFHPSNVWTIAEINKNAAEILHAVEVEGQKQLESPNLKLSLADKVVNGKLKIDQGVVAGCAGGTFENIAAVAEILNNKSVGNGEFSLNVYPASQPVYMGLIANKAIEKLVLAGANIKSAFCGPCFGAGDTPANNGLSVRHVTRNFPNREGSKPASGQLASVALMDARSIAATALNGGILTSAAEVEVTPVRSDYSFNTDIYNKRVYQGFGLAKPEAELKFGPNIADWPKMIALPKNLLLKLVTVIHDPVTTTDELMPSGETSSYRSNPLKLAEFALSRKDPAYVGKAKAIQQLEFERRKAALGGKLSDDLQEIYKLIGEAGQEPLQLFEDTGLGSVIFAVKPGDGSAREQAASSQKVLGGQANIAIEYATKRYRSNLINWGMLPFTIEEGVQAKLKVNDYVFIPGIRQAVIDDLDRIPAVIINDTGKTSIELKLENLSKDDRDIILAGCLMNYYAQ